MIVYKMFLKFNFFLFYTYRDAAGIVAELNSGLINFGNNVPRLFGSVAGGANLADPGGYYRVSADNASASILQMIVRGANTSNETLALAVNSAGNVSIPGALSKGSGTFDIQHPLKSNKSNRLVHSFVEGPRCDLIYRNTVQLVNGSATVDINMHSVESQDCAMTPGTFEALCKNIDLFLQNKTGYARLKGSVVGSILTIECEENTNDTVSWMVVGERQDQFIKEWNRTNTNGSLVTEYNW